MAKIVKDKREVMNVEEELKKIESTKKKTKKEDSKSTSKKDEKKKETKKKQNQKVKTKKGKKKSGLFAYLKSVKSEISKVKWPSKKDMIKYSIATIVFIIFFALFFYCIDLILATIKEVVRNG